MAKTLIEIDLWEGIPLALPKKKLDLLSKNVELNQASIIDEKDNLESFLSSLKKSLTKLPVNKIALEIYDERLYLYSKQNINNLNDFQKFFGIKEECSTKGYIYSIKLTSINAWLARFFLKGKNPLMVASTAKKLTSLADVVPPPTVKLSPDKKYLEIVAPFVEPYNSILNKLGAWRTSSNIWKIHATRTLDLKFIEDTRDDALPSFIFSDDVEQLNTEEIYGFDGTLESLKHISTDTLNVVKNGVTNGGRRGKKQQVLLSDSLSSFGINNLHDLLFTLPKRHLDKSNPQSIDNLLIGEEATIVGRIKSISALPRDMGTIMQISDGVEISNLIRANSIEAMFWRQGWLTAKYKVGDEVLLTGKVGFYNGRKQINGDSKTLGHLDEASILPIMPIYKQAPSKNITTQLLMNANRELISRLNELQLPTYFQNNREGALSLLDSLREIHFPTSIEDYEKALLDFAYYELVYMQLIMQEAKENNELSQGISQGVSSRNLQEKLLKVLPFSLTRAQESGVKQLNEKLENKVPSNTLLVADVGAGKTLVAQMASLRAVENNYQAVIMAPTDILAKQLFNSTIKLCGQINEKFDENIVVEFLGGGLKAAEKRSVLKRVKEGEVNIIVGTHSVVSDKVEYANLGFVAIDEQQKFGTMQRTKLLKSREDDRIPDLLLQTATPIPRSTAQVIFGDMDMIYLDEKPAGRIEIDTHWINTDPQDVISTLFNPMWDKVIEEAGRGNQTFIVTPLVFDSDKVDAASVERTFETLKAGALSSLRLGFVHGSMKKAEQDEIMRAFRAKEFDVLVSSTVVEVGVDISDATICIILSAERMGASSAHQIRGRVGRSNKPSTCYLVSNTENANSVMRLQSLVNSNDGFAIAEDDLKLRGHGTVFSSNQSGKSELLFANLSEHVSLINEAKEEAISILNSNFRESALKDANNKFSAFESNGGLF